VESRTVSSYTSAPTLSDDWSSLPPSPLSSTMTESPMISFLSLNLQLWVRALEEGTQHVVSTLRARKEEACLGGIHLLGPVPSS
jgi:hypothetical protein